MNKDILSAISFKDLLQYLGVFLLIFISAKFGQYLFYEWNTSPAILWPPTGIALSIMWLYGYRFAIPVFLGLFAASATGPSAHLFPGVITTPLGQTLSHVTAVYLLKRVGFTGSFAVLRNVLVFLFVIAAAYMVAPTITTTISAITGNLSTAAYISWSRAWAGYIFSALILFPLIVSWARPDSWRVERSKLEVGFVSVLLLSSVYFLFWTQTAANFIFVFFALFFIAHFWAGLRLSTKAVTLSMFVTTVIGILGLFISPAPGKLLNSQLFATELFLFLVVPIFYAFSALVKERANTIEELKVALQRIEKESLLKNDFIAILAHELRNPLAPVKTTIELLQLQNLSPDISRLLANAHQQVHSMRRLLDDLLDITRVTQGKFQLQVERISFSELLKRAINSTSELIRLRNHRITFTESDESILLDVDPVRFEQVLVNILNNAAKYTDPGGDITVTHTVSTHDVRIEIRDTGRGIEAEHIAHIFQPFWQIESAVPHAIGGIGVGLSLTKHIVEMHGGTIHAESAGLGKGSTFIITMPLSSKTSMDQFTDSQSNARPIRPFRILVVDDNHDAVDALEQLLRMKGHTVAKAYAGSEVHTIATDFSPEVILLDIGLPDMSGYDVASALRKGGYQGYIVAVTGYGQSEDKQLAEKAGCNYHITKPMGIARLEEYLVSIS